MVADRKTKIVLTGDRPTGKLHLGHYVGSLINRVGLQDEHKQYIMIADVQALTDNFEHPDKITENVYEIVADYISVGIDPLKTTIFLQSQIPELAELTMYYLNLVTLSRLERNPTIKTEIQQKGYSNSIPAGFLCYPVSQAADITAFKTDIVPVGEDQLPMIEQTNEIVRRFNRIYNTTCLQEVTPVVGEVGRLVGTDGNAKASKSLGNAIFLSDSPDDIKKKVYSMYTDPHHIKVSDPGQVEGNVIFSYLDAFHHDKEEVSDLKAHYRKGGLGDTTIKSILNITLQNMLLPIQEKRMKLKKEYLRNVIMEGTKNAHDTVLETIAQVRLAIGLQY